MGVELNPYIVERKGGISGLGSSGFFYVGEFHSKCSEFGTIVHLGSKHKKTFFLFL